MTLKDCFDMKSAHQIIDYDLKWKCPTCKEIVQAEKWESIYSTGSILVVALQRFTAKSKISTFVDYPLEQFSLPTKSRQNKPLIYDLIAVCVQEGSLDSGHYTAYGKVKEEWYYYDDQSVRQATAKEVVCKGAYMLFY